MTLPNTSWPFAALLWLQTWSQDAVLVHIPRTGGTSLEKLDLGAPLYDYKRYAELAGRRHSFVNLLKYAAPSSQPPYGLGCA